MSWAINELWFDSLRDQEVLISPKCPGQLWDRTRSTNPMGTWGSLSGAENKASHSLPHSAMVKNAWNYTSIPPYAFMVCTGTTLHHCILTLILRRSRTGTVWFYTSTRNKRAARPKLYTKSLTRDLKLMYSRLTLVRISINL